MVENSPSIPQLQAQIRDREDMHKRIRLVLQAYPSYVRFRVRWLKGDTEWTPHRRV